MEFGREKCDMLIMTRRKLHMNERINLPNQEKKIRTLGKNKTYKYFGILEDDAIKQVEMKGEMKKHNLRRTRKLLKTNLYSRNLIKGINT